MPIFSKNSLVVALVTAAALPTLPACSTAAAPAEAQSRQSGSVVVPVRTEEVVTAALDAPIRAPGRVVAKRQVDLAFEVGGVISEVLVDEGDTVHRGDVLARLEPVAIRAREHATQVALEKAERDHARASVLHDRGSIPEAARQDAATAVELARANHDAALFDARHLVLVAPADGRVDLRLGERGEVVGPGMPVLRMTSEGGGYVVRAAVSDRDILDVHEGDAATVSLDAMPGREMSARVTRVAGQSSPATGLFDVEVTLDNLGTRLEGLSAKVAISRQDPERRVIPIAALVDGHGDEASVYVPNATGTSVERLDIRVARLVGDRVAVLRGLENVPVVITEGAERITNGARIRILR